MGYSVHHADKQKMKKMLCFFFTIMIFGILLSFFNMKNNKNKMRTNQANSGVSFLTSEWMLMEDCKPSGKFVFDMFVDYPQLQIFSMDLSTKREEILTEVGDFSNPKWFPDGEKIYFNYWSEVNLFDIFLMDKDGNNITPFLTTPVDEWVYDYSKDGKVLLLEIDTLEGEEGRRIETYLYNLETNENKRVTFSDTFSSNPVFSNDEQKIAYASSDGGVGRTQIFTIAVDGTNRQQLTEYNVSNFDGYPIWCPDDSCILFLRNGKIMSINLDTSEIAPFFANNIIDAEDEIFRISYSATRKNVLISTFEKTYIMNVDEKKICILNRTSEEINFALPEALSVYP